SQTSSSTVMVTCPCRSIPRDYPQMIKRPLRGYGAEGQTAGVLTNAVRGKVAGTMENGRGQLADRNRRTPVRSDRTLWTAAHCRVVSRYPTERDHAIPPLEAAIGPEALDQTQTPRRPSRLLLATSGRR